MTATKRKPKPITANPLFPLLTGLWFATLFGLGSFVSAPMLLEGPVLALGIPAHIPAAAPPLGFTTRIIFAAAMMGFGAVVGYSLGRFFCREKSETSARSRGFGKKANSEPAAKGRRPINAAEDLGAPLDAPLVQETRARRRQLVEQEQPPVVATPAFITTPIAEAPVFKERHEFQPSIAANAPPLGTKAVDTLALDLLLEEVNVIEPAPFATSQPLFAAPQRPLEQPATTTQLETPAFQVEAPDHVVLDRVAVAPEPAPFAKVEAAQPPHTTLVEPAPVKQAFMPPAPAPQAPVPQESAQQSFLQPPPFLQAQAVTATPIDRELLENLGLVQLIERLALAISRRTAQIESAEQTQPQMAEVVSLEPVVPAPMARFKATASAPAPSATPNVQPDIDNAFERAPFAPAKPERVVQLRPEALEPLRSVADMAADTDDEEQDIGLERFLRMSPPLSRKPQEMAESCGMTSEVAPEPEVDEECYPSLLDMASATVRREPLRIDDSIRNDDAVIEQVVVFPGQEAPWSAEAAKAAPLHSAPTHAASTTAPFAQSRPFERPLVVPVPGSPLASPGRAAPSAQVANPNYADGYADNAAPAAGTPDAEEADRALRAALATLQRMTVRG